MNTTQFYAPLLDLSTTMHLQRYFQRKQNLAPFSE